MSQDDPDDEISRILTRGSEFERLRLVGGVFTGLSLRQKVRLHGLTLVALSLVYPIALVLPPAVGRLFPGPRPALGSPNVVVLGCFAALTQAFAGTLTWLVGRRLARADADAVTARRLVALESIGSVVGFGTGGIAAALTLGFFLVNLAGIGTAQALRGALAGARGPYAPSQIAVSVRAFAVVTLFAGLCLLVAARRTAESPSR
ncbi:hypothetical protein [Halorientalis regularis]|jgi:hypothetical protein|uniref:Uncharacterized protein n=1 Tax=Halorientalis regularis TaxID=660518 RepID=A0A1G7R7S6_9EURY|nr:hypothetical protein [Halorientalis regularis]SDG06841.1 hypothetical protein SAMN05216218_11493 [Halorientalis regularis]